MPNGTREPFQGKNLFVAPSVVMQGSQVSGFSPLSLGSTYLKWPIMRNQKCPPRIHLPHGEKVTGVFLKADLQTDIKKNRVVLQNDSSRLSDMCQWGTCYWSDTLNSQFPFHSHASNLPCFQEQGSFKCQWLCKWNLWEFTHETYHT